MNFTEVYLLDGRNTQVMHMSRANTGEPFVLKGFTGLDIDTIQSRFYAKGADGNPFYALNLGKREIVLRVVVSPNYSNGQTVESLRSLVYKAIQSNRLGTMTVRFDNGEYTQAVIKGFPTKLEVAHFSNVPELQLTLDCSRDPLLRSEDEVVQSIFPEYPDLVVNDTQSTAPHGFRMSLTCDTNVSKIRFYDASPNTWEFEVSPGTIGANTGFRVNDIVGFSSEDKNRQIFLVRGGDVYHLAHKIKPGSIWPYMFPGTNTFRMDSGFGLDTLTYRKAYWGV